jgi:hypothetical protein
MPSVQNQIALYQPQVSETEAPSLNRFELDSKWEPSEDAFTTKDAYAIGPGRVTGQINEFMKSIGDRQFGGVEG